jgi:hypothetical protein
MQDQRNQGPWSVSVIVPVVCLLIAGVRLCDNYELFLANFQNMGPSRNVRRSRTRT